MGRARKSGGPMPRAASRPRRQVYVPDSGGCLWLSCVSQFYKKSARERFKKLMGVYPDRIVTFVEAVRPTRSRGRGK